MRSAWLWLACLFAASPALPSPIADPPLTLTIHMHWPRAQGYDEAYPVEQAARAKTGIYLKDRTFAKNRKNSGEAMRLLLSEGELPDIVGGHQIKDWVNQYGPEGAFQPLDQLITAYAPHIQAFFDRHPQFRRAVTAWDGHIYYIPYFPDGKFGRAYFIRQDWLDRLGLQLPNTADELFDVLVAFRDRDPNGNGLADEIPVFMRHWQELIRLVTLWDGRSSGSDIYHDFLAEDGRVIHPYTTAGYREGIRNLADWYAQGLIDPQLFERGPAARDDLLRQNRGGMTHDWFASTASYNSVLADQIPGFDFAPFLPPASVSGRRIEEHRRAPVKPDGWAISHSNAHPVETIRYFDFWFSDEGRRLANFGVEGEQYDLINGAAVFRADILRSGSPVNTKLYEIGAQIPRGFPQDYLYEWQWTSQAARDGIALYEQHDLLVEPFLGVALNEEEQETYDIFWKPIRSYMLKRQRGWLLGEGSIEADWPSYIETLDEMGYGAVMDAMNSAYRRQYDKAWE